MNEEASSGRPIGVVLDGDVLRERRRTLGLTQSDVADLAGLTARTLQSAERGKRISTPNAVNLASALGVPLVALVRMSPEDLKDRLVQAGHAPLAPPEGWAGRAAELARLVATFTPERSPHALPGSDAATLVVVVGPSGIGKSTLAKKAAAELAATFPDGVVWVHANALRDARDAVVLLLDIGRCFGIGSQLPNPNLVEPAAFARAFRHFFWRRPRLLVLDDVTSVDQIAWFRDEAVPEPQRILVTTTMRSVAQELKAARIELGPLDEAEGLDLLARTLGGDAVRSDPASARALVQGVGGLPRAIVVAGEILRRERFTSLDEYVRRLRDGAGDDPIVELADKTFAAAYAQVRSRIAPAAWQAFGTLGVFGHLSFPLSWALAVVGGDPRTARSLLGALRDVHLVHELAGADHPPSAPGDPWLALDAQAQRAARSIGDMAEAETRLVAHAVALTRAAGTAAPDLYRALPGLFHAVLERAAAFQPEARRPWPTPPLAGRAPAAPHADALFALTRALEPALVRDPSPDIGRALLAAASAARSRDPALAAVCARAFGAWLEASAADFAAARAWLTHAAALFEEAHDLAEASTTHGRAAPTAYWLQRPDLMLDDIGRAVATAREAGRPIAAAVAQVMMLAGRVHVDDDWPALARDLSTIIDDPALAPHHDGDDDLRALVLSLARVNRAVARYNRGVPHAEPQLGDAFATLVDTAARDDQAEVMALRLVAMAMGVNVPRGEPLALGDATRLASAHVLQVTPERAPLTVYRMLILNSGLATWLGLIPSAPGFAPRRDTVIMPILIGGAHERRAGHFLALLVPLRACRYLLDSGLMAQATAFARATCAADHPLLRVVGLLARHLEEPPAARSAAGT